MIYLRFLGAELAQSAIGKLAVCSLEGLPKQLAVDADMGKVGARYGRSLKADGDPVKSPTLAGVVLMPVSDLSINNEIGRLHFTCKRLATSG